MEVADFLPNAQAVAQFSIYMAYLAFLSFVVPGKTYKGTKLMDGSTLAYKTNGLNILIVLLASAFFATQLKLVSPTILVDNFWQIGRAVQQECRDRSRMPSSA
eukprot:TRINITY_DN23067_c0_g1_i2.p1 TRINITY_DN23067_c0_g1~~TRINITY_DN23067_c0_g1_i2.p1  ORF type:complete len:103 (+),score=11.26 TRINITY_DN23067_c0_g1_i2:77-385(+)